MQLEAKQRGTRALRRRVEREGIEGLRPEELIELIVGAPLMQRGGVERLLRLAEMSLPELRGELELPPVAAMRLRSAFALGRWIESARRPPRLLMNSAESIWRYLRVESRGLLREMFWVLLLDGRHRLQRVETVSVGTLTTSLVHPREVFRAAVREGAAAVVVAHNHPSGDPEPSPEDIDVTQRLLDVASLIGIPLLDHVVLGEASWVSLRARLDFGAERRGWSP